MLTVGLLIEALREYPAGAPIFHLDEQLGEWRAMSHVTNFAVDPGDPNIPVLVGELIDPDVKLDSHDESV